MKLSVTMVCFLLPMVLSIPSASAQIFDVGTKVKYDTNYIQVYKDELTTRLFFSRKQNGYTLSDRLLQPWIKYKTNDNLLLGLGYTYSFLTLNLALKMPVFNSDNELYGASRYLDLQTHSIFRSFIMDLYLQWNKGYYLSNPANVIPNWDTNESLPLRGDLRTNVIGLNVQYLFNSSRYSYKASFVQNEFQKKSAGSPIAGIEAYWMLGMADSILIPMESNSGLFLEGALFNQTDIANIGVNGGYAYTFVWEKTLYASFSSVVGLSGGYNRVHQTVSSNTCCSGMAFGLNNSTRISLGYNNPTYYVGLSYIFFTMRNRVGNQGDWIAYSTGNIRFNVVRRFRLKRPIKLLRPDLWTF